MVMNLRGSELCFRASKLNTSGRKIKFNIRNGLPKMSPCAFTIDASLLSSPYYLLCDDEIFVGMIKKIFLSKFFSFFRND